MKLSKVLLQAIFAGVTAGAATSCDDLMSTDDLPHVHTKVCAEVCTEIQQQQQVNREPCLACGMG